MITCGLVPAASHATVLENLSVIEFYIEEAVRKNCSVLCFPEAFLTGYSSKDTEKLAIASDHTVFLKLKESAVKNKIDLLVGYMEKKENNFYLTHDIFTAGGQRFSYRKTHLGDREKQVFKAGNTLPVFPLSCGINAAIQLCVENHYPEITQTYSLKGADIVFAPHAVPRAAGDRKKIWSKFIPARSYDNRVYMACCNQWGGCFVTDPAGETVVSYFEEEEKLICFSFDSADVEKYHGSSPKMSARYYPAKRRSELYHR